jgi:polycystin 1L2
LNSQNLENGLYGFGWSQFNQSYSPPNGYLSIYNAFQYKDAYTLQGSPIQGKFATYDGSGYLYELRGKLDYIQGNLSLLQQMQWIDRQTRAVFIEFSSYNPNINLIMVSTILIEFLSSGSILTTARFDPLNLFAETNGISFKTISVIILFIYIIYFMYIQVRDLYKRGILEYMSDFWSYIEWSIISTALISFAMFIYRLIVAKEVLDFFKRTSGYGYMKLQSVNDCNLTLTYSLGLCVAFSTIKYLKMLRFNKHISHLGLTLKSCLSELMSFSFILFLIWMAFVQLMYLFYGSYLGGYASLIKSAETAFVVMLGKFDSSEYMQQNTLIGPFIFSAYNIVMICFILNIFISIITDAFEKVRLEYMSNPRREFHFWSTGKMIVHNFFENKQENHISKRKPKYRDHMSVFPKRVDQLSKYVIRVSLVKYIYFFSVRRDYHDTL